MFIQKQSLLILVFATNPNFIIAASVLSWHNYWIRYYSWIKIWPF